MSLDEEQRAEFRLTSLGHPSRRRVVELGRLASALSAMQITEDEIALFGRILPESVRVEITAGMLAGLRAVFRNERITVTRVAPGGPVVFKQAQHWSPPDYGPPKWLEDLEEMRRDQARETLSEILGRTTVGVLSDPGLQFRLAPPSRELRQRFSRTLLPERRTSSPSCAPAASARAFAEALGSLGPPRRRRRR